MLKKCPECKAQISDKAIICPHCGYPISTDASDKIAKKVKKASKRLRLPNGFGRITEIKNQNLRKPFRVMVTVGKTPEGKPIGKLLKPNAFFATYEEAYQALEKYHKNPYDIEKEITVRELYEKWYDEYKEEKSQSISTLIQIAWTYCSSIYDMKVADVRARHIKGCIDDGYVIKDSVKKPVPLTIKPRIKSLFNMLLDYAVEYEIVDKNFAKTFKIKSTITDNIEENKKEHVPFTDDEMKKLWNNLYTVEDVDILLIQCYTGLRPQELGLIQIKNVDLNNKTIICGIKTKAGKNRIVPIHSKIYKLIEKRYEIAVNAGNEYLFTCLNSNKCMTYDTYRRRFLKIIEHLNMNPEHRSHDGRVHFVTTAKRYNVDEYAIKYIVGHAIMDLTEKVYTKRNVQWLKAEIEKIK